MNNLYSSNLSINYGQFYITPDEENFDEDAWDTDEAFKDQKNGICGASVKGHLFFITGIQDGTISVDIQLCDKAPPIDDSYGEIVEVSLEVASQGVFLTEWGSENTHKLDIPNGKYAVRYSIDGMDKDYDDEIEDENQYESPVPGQRHLIQLWIDEPAEDIVVKVSTEHAKYWHKEWGAG